MIFNKNLCQSQEEVRIVYQNIRKLDVTDKANNIHLVDIDKIFYCHQQGNFTEIHTVQNKKYTRLPDFDTFFSILRIFLIFSIVLRHPKFLFKKRLDLLVPICKE